MIQKSGNPFLRKSFSKVETNVYDAQGNPVYVIDRNETMTVNGTINKTLILFALLFAGALVPFFMLAAGLNPFPAAIACTIVALVLVFVASYSPKTSVYVAPAYALFKGVFVTTVSMLIEASSPKMQGIVLQAVMGTLVTFGVCLALYRFRIIKVTERFTSIAIAATLAVISYYFISILFSMFSGVQPFHMTNSLASIGFSLFLIVLACMHLLIDFAIIEEGAKQGLPKYMEWYCGLGLMVTIIWLYLEILKLLAKSRGRN